MNEQNVLQRSWDVFGPHIWAPFWLQAIGKSGRPPNISVARTSQTYYSQCSTRPLPAPATLMAGRGSKLQSVLVRVSERILRQYRKVDHDLQVRMLMKTSKPLANIVRKHGKRATINTRQLNGKGRVNILSSYKVDQAAKAAGKKQVGSDQS